jgi:hypothetical protein
MKQTNIRLRDIRLRKPAPVVLGIAENLLRDKRDAARESQNVTNCAVVGIEKVDVQLDRVCHACLSSMLVHPDDRDRKYESRWNAKANPWGGGYEYYNDQTKEWQQQFVYLTPPKIKRRNYPYRYLVGWSNHQLKPQYAEWDECAPFRGERLRACQMYYDWLRNHSHFSRFFVGPRDVRTLSRYGYILDLDAPSFVIHTIAVAWRMPGESVELVEEWYHLVQRGVDPNLAFGVVQKVIGFHKGDDGQLFTYGARGHVFCDVASTTTIARFAEGVAKYEPPCSKDCHDYMKLPARYTYSTSNLVAWEAVYGNSQNGWLKQVQKERPELLVEKEVPQLWGNPIKKTDVAAGAFQRSYDPGFVWLLGKVGEACREWRR